MDGSVARFLTCLTFAMGFEDVVRDAWRGEMQHRQSLVPPQEEGDAHPRIVLLGCDDDGIESERSEPADW